MKAITRLLLFKAGRKEHVTRDVIAKCLEELNPDFKSYANVVLDLANTKLQTLFDYRVIAWYPRIGTKLPGFSGGIVSATVEPASTNNSSSSSSSAGGASSVPTYYVVNCSHNPRLLAILADPSLATSTDHDDVVIAHSSDHIAAYQAFCYVVLTLLFISPGRKVKAEDLLAMLRKIDPRFPETDLQTTKASDKTSGVYAVPELRASFPNLIKRMKDDGYLVVTKDATEGAKSGTTAAANAELYSMGPRAHLEVGVIRLVKAYFAACGVPVNDTLLKDIRIQEGLQTAST